MIAFERRCPKGASCTKYHHKDSARDGIWRCRSKVAGAEFDKLVHGTRGVAQAAYNDLLKRAHDGDLSKSVETTAGFLAAYTDRRVISGELRAGRPATTERGLVKNHVLPHLPERLADVKAAHVQAVNDAMVQAERERSTPHARAVLTGAFRFALETAELKGRNPMDGVRWTRVRKAERKIPRTDEVARIIEATAPEYRVAMATAAATWLRASEVADLRWSNVNLDGGRCADRGDKDCPSIPHAHVEGGLHRVTGGFTHNEPKSKHGRRVVPLSAAGADMLKRHRTAQNERRLLAGPAWTTEDLVFDHGAGEPTDPANFGDAFRAAAKRAKVTGYTFHALRHYGITEAVNAGKDAGKVSRTAGHASVAFTLSTYYHLDVEETATLADVVEAGLGEVLGRL